MNNISEEGEIWLIDKPYEWTSFDVLRKLKHIAIRISGNKKIKIGHAGTLDPLATGLLIVCVGKKTKLISGIQDGVKEYTGIICTGARTASYDRETEIIPVADATIPDAEQIEIVRSSFIGEQLQYPPLHSAKMVDGKRSYELVRAGKEVELKANTISIHKFEITEISLPFIHFRIVCSKGTYIRSIAHDFGNKLGCGAYLHELRRTGSGNFRIEDAMTLEEKIYELTGEKTEIQSSRRAFLKENRK